MTEITPFAFEGQDVRVVTDEHGEPWFVAKDVAVLLGYLDPTNAIKQHCRGVVFHHPIVDSLGRRQLTRIISEPDVLRLIVSSKLPSAQAFERHLFEVILPQIRRTGSYVAPAEDDATLMARALVAAQNVLSAKDAQIAELEPRAEAFDVFLSADGDYLVGDAAKMLARAGVDTGPQRLFESLADFGWTFRGGDGKWRAKQSAVNDGYLVEKPMSHHHPRTGELVADAPQVRVTPRGLERLRVRLGRNSLILVS